MLNFEIKRQDFLNSLFIVQGASEKKGSLPILSNLLIESVNNELIKISATDLEISIITYSKAKVVNEGKVCINSRRLYGVVKESPEGTPDGTVISFKTDGQDSSGIVTVSYQNYTANLTTTPVVDYPTIIDIDNEIKKGFFKPEDSFTINFKILKKLISGVIFSTSLNEETKRNLTGVFFSLVEANKSVNLRLVATDGHRLAMSDIENRGQENQAIELNEKEGIYFNINKESEIYNFFKSGVIIPKKVLNEILKLEDGSSVNIYINSNNIFFNFNVPERSLKGDKKSKIKSGGGAQIISRLIEGKFPDYQTVLPKSNYKTAVINTKDLFNSIKRVSLLAEEKSHSIELGFNENNLLIKTVNAGVGEGSDELEIKYNGEPLNIKLNSKYILDFLSILSGEKILSSFNTIYSPFVIEPFIEEDRKGAYGEPAVTGVFMPMRY